MSLYVTQLYAGDWYVCTTTGSPRNEWEISYRAPVFDTREQAQAWLARAKGFNTELTPAGEQTVIPGCERNASPRTKQLDLF